MSVSFGLASTHGCAVVDDAEDRRAGGMTKRPSWMLSTCVAVPAIGARSDRVVEIALRLIERGLGLRVSGELLERQIGVAKQLVERGCRAAAR